jgi:hypothetical protein
MFGGARAFTANEPEEHPCTRQPGSLENALIRYGLAIHEIGYITGKRKTP